MAPRNGRPDKQLKKRVEQKTDSIVLIFAIVGLVACGAVNATVAILAAPGTGAPIPQEVFWGLIAAIVPDAVKAVRTRQ